MRSIHPKAPGEQSRPSRDPFRLARKSDSAEQNAIRPLGTISHHIHAVVDAIAHIDVKPPWLTEQGFVLRGTASVTVTGGIVLGIRLRFHHHTPKQAAVVLAFHQPAAHQVRSNDFCGAAEEGVGQGWNDFGEYLSTALSQERLEI